MQNEIIQNYQVFKENLIEILANSEYDKLVNFFVLNDKVLGKDIEQIFWDALSKGTSIKSYSQFY